MSKQKISTTEAIMFAKTQICDNPENAQFVIAFIKTFIEGLKAAGEYKDKSIEDLMIHGALMGYALRYIEEQP